VRVTERASSDPTPLSQGDSDHGHPGEGRGRRSMEPLKGNTARALNLGTVSTQRHRITSLVTFGSEAML
jgi:hypothetical protein